MKLIVGLGNPGFRYANTRHNVGFWVVDRLAKQAGIGLTRRAHEAIIGGGQLAGQSVVLAKPQTFMNVSGRSVAALRRFYKTDLADVLIIYDELDLPPGRLRLRGSGSAGGHNGMKSVIAALGTDQITRLRLGIGRPPDYLPAADYVLQPPAASELEELQAAVARAAACVETWVRDGLAAAMNEWNG